jgi:hypothetical protein
MIGQEDIGFSFFEGAFNFNFHWKEYDRKERFSPVLIDFSPILIPSWNPDATKEKRE